MDAVDPASLSSLDLIQYWAVVHRPLFAGILFVLGALIGSFLNVVIYRLPLERSIVRPGSRCMSCDAPIRFYDNIPILSWLILRGRCRHCKERFSVRYPLVEALTGFLAAALFWEFGLSRALPIHFAFTAALVAITFIDFDHRIIPNEISLPGILIGFGCSFLAREGFWVESLVGLGVGGGGLLILSLGYYYLRGREGMGMGDVKLLAMLGAWLGWRSLLFIVLFASIQGVLATVVMALAGVKLKPPLPEEWELEEEERARAEAAGAADGAADADASAGEAGQGEGEGEEEGEEEEEAVGFFGAAIPFGPFLALAAVEYLFFGQLFFDWIAGR